ncbi:uncharacterized protein [Drosophila takahashii]|uniref:uncharacterized protein n=1 Tax=Drosophila takahashii TaxID=29030 RepID=UPI001CF8721E|nr:uncharacterized protein LOC123002413 [Drosophila takahashii]
MVLRREKATSRWSFHHPNWKNMVHKCRMCHKGHPLRFCAKLLKLDSLERRQAARRMGYYANCLASTHRLHECKSKEVCHRCGDLHHTLLHAVHNGGRSISPSNKQKSKVVAKSTTPKRKVEERRSRSTTRRASSDYQTRQYKTPSRPLLHLQEAIRNLTKLKEILD